MTHKSLICVYFSPKWMRNGGNKMESFSTHLYLSCRLSMTLYGTNISFDIIDPVSFFILIIIVIVIMFSLPMFWIETSSGDLTKVLCIFFLLPTHHAMTIIQLPRYICFCDFNSTLPLESWLKGIKVAHKSDPYVAFLMVL